MAKINLQVEKTPRGYVVEEALYIGDKTGNSRVITSGELKHIIDNLKIEGRGSDSGSDIRPVNNNTESSFNFILANNTDYAWTKPIISNSAAKMPLLSDVEEKNSRFMVNLNFRTGEDISLNINATTFNSKPIPIVIENNLDLQNTSYSPSILISRDKWVKVLIEYDGVMLYIFIQDGPIRIPHTD